MWHQTTDPFNNQFVSTIVAALPILFLFAALISKKIAGHLTALLTLLVGLIVAIVAYGMPAKLAFLSASYGILSGMFPIGWIVLTAVFLYNLSVKSGGFTVVRDTIESVTADRRIQALLIAFCFGAFLEGSAGFGAPVAITTGMLVGLGFQPLYAAGICLIANTAPVAFGGIGIAIVTAGNVSGIDPLLISKMVAHQLPLLAFILPFWLVALISGWKGMKEVIPAILVTSISYSVTMYLVATYLGPSLPDILSATVSIFSLILFLKIWQPKNIWRFPNEKAITSHHKITHSFSETLRAWTPFALLILFVGNWGASGIQSYLAKTTVKWAFPGLDHAIQVGNKALTIVYSFGWLSAAGTAIVFAAIVSTIIMRLPISLFFRTAWETIVELWRPLVTIGSVVGFAYLANYSGITTTLGAALTLTGVLFPFISPFLGWLGTFITGSDTSSNALFSGMQHTTATHLDLNPVLTVTANTTGGVTGKMISPQSIAVATASSGLVGQEGKLFRFTILHSLGLVTIIGVMTYLQAYFVPGMVPELVSAAAVVQKSGLSSGEVALASTSILLLAALAILNIRLAIPWKELPKEATVHISE